VVTAATAAANDKVLDREILAWSERRAAADVREAMHAVVFTADRTDDVCHITARGQQSGGAPRRPRHHSRDQRDASRHRQPISDRRQPSSISASCLLSHAFRLLFGFCFDWSDRSDLSDWSDRIDRIDRFQLSAFQSQTVQIMAHSRVGGNE
jgi:hypothetical protein